MARGRVGVGAMANEFLAGWLLVLCMLGVGLADEISRKRTRRKTALIGVGDREGELGNGHTPLASVRCSGTETENPIFPYYKPTT